MKVLVEVPSNEIYSFMEQIKNKSYQILEDRDVFFTESQIKILDERKDTPKNQFITREELKANLRNRYAL
ncbi:MAG: hypothetical protein ACK5UE_01980 [Chitinophagales bacterium]|jgi:hypothetical protein